MNWEAAGALVCLNSITKWCFPLTPVTDPNEMTNFAKVELLKEAQRQMG